MRKIVLAGMLAGLAIVQAGAQDKPDGPPAGPQVWRNIGPDRGGRSLTAAGSSRRPNEYYFGAVGGGLWKNYRWRHELEACNRRADQGLLGGGTGDCALEP